MPGKQLVPYDPNQVPRYQSAKPSLLKRFNDAIEALVVDGQGAEHAALGGALGLAFCLAFTLSAALVLFYSMQVGIVTGKAWSHDPDGPTAGMVNFAWWWFLETCRRWNWIIGLWLAFAIVPGVRHGQIVLANFYRRRRRRKDEARDVERQRVQSYQQGLVVAAERERVAARDAAKVVEAGHQRARDYHAGRANALRVIEQKIHEALDRERFAHMTEDEPTEAAYLRVRASLKKLALPPEYGLLHETRDMDVIRVLGRSRKWLPPEIPMPHEFSAVLPIGNM